MATFTIVRGDTRTFTLTVTFPTGAPSVDLADYNIWFTAKKVLSDQDTQAIWQHTKLDTITVTGAATATMRVDGPDTAGLVLAAPSWTQVLNYDVQIEHIATSSITTVDSGTITVTADVTRAV